MEYTLILTHKGRQLETQAKITGQPVRLAAIAVGDGGGTVPTPDAARSSLLCEMVRLPIESMRQDMQESSLMWIKATLLAHMGGWWIREVGIFTDAGDLYAYGNHAPFYKALPADGTALEHELELGLMVTDSGIVEIVVNTMGNATVQFVRELLDDHNRQYGAHLFRIVDLEQRLSFYHRNCWG